MERILCAALALVVTACATGGMRLFSEAEPRTQGYTAAFVFPPNPTAPNIFVTADTKMILVDQEPIYPPPGAQVSIYFGLEQNGPYEFHSNGIEIRGNPDFCKPAGQFVVKCSYQRPAPGTEYKYKVRVRPVGGGQPLKDLDPTIMN